MGQKNVSQSVHLLESQRLLCLTRLSLSLARAYFSLLNPSKLLLFVCMHEQIMQAITVNLRRWLPSGGWGYADFNINIVSL